MKKRVTVYGVISTNEGVPYQGALVRFSLSQPFFYAGNFYPNTELEAVTNKFGIFELELVPSTLSHGNFYYVRVIYDNILNFKFVVPESDTPLNFSDLTEFSDEFDAEIGDCC